MPCSAPPSAEESAEIAELIRWFTRRYPTPKERLAYARRKFSEWTRPVTLVKRCDRLEMPEGLVAYRRTAEFDEASIPAALRKDHATKPGVWGMIRVVAGRLRYCVDAVGGREYALDPGTPGVIAPEVLHHVAPDGPVRFFVEFYRKPDI